MIARARALGLLAWLVAAPACLSSGVTTELRPDGIYHIQCKAPLQRCLDQAEMLCNHERYAVLRAFDLQDYKGDTAQPQSFRSSEAFIRCGVRGGWGENINELKDQDLCPAPPAPPRSLSCTPGASVACVGAGGCRGGQVCLPEGGKFGPCDCGAAPPPAAPAPPSAPTPTP
jgi:hypothetical protein